MSAVSDPRVGPIRVLAAPSGEQVGGNPYLSSLYRHVRQHDVDVAEFSRKAAVRGVDVIHIHWPELLITWDRGGAYAIWDAGKVLMVLFIARIRGASLIWTGHNLEPHDLPQPWIFTGYWAVLGRLLDHVITLNDAAGHRLRRRYPWLTRVPMSVIRHGDYRDEYPPVTSPTATPVGEAVRRPAILAFGQLRRYKRFHELLGAFIDAGAPGQLVIAGSPSRALTLAAQMQADAARSSGVTLKLRYLEPSEVSALHADADVVVLPYDQVSALNSGSALLALSLGRRVVLPASPPHEELSTLVGPGWVHQVEGGVAALLERALQVGAEPPPENEPDLTSMAWDHIGLQTATLFKQLAVRRRDTTAAGSAAQTRNVSQAEGTEHGG